MTCRSSGRREEASSSSRARSQRYKNPVRPIRLFGAFRLSATLKGGCVSPLLCVLLQALSTAWNHSAAGFSLASTGTSKQHTPFRRIREDLRVALRQSMFTHFGSLPSVSHRFDMRQSCDQLAHCASLRGDPCDLSAELVLSPFNFVVARSQCIPPHLRSCRVSLQGANIRRLSFDDGLTARPLPPSTPIKNCD